MLSDKNLKQTPPKDVSSPEGVFFFAFYPSIAHRCSVIAATVTLSEVEGSKNRYVRLRAFPTHFFLRCNKKMRASRYALAQYDKRQVAAATCFYPSIEHRCSVIVDDTATYKRKRTIETFGSGGLPPLYKSSASCTGFSFLSLGLPV